MLEATATRHSGIPSIGDVPWGTHFCQFYQNQDDLVEILVPYFQAGLEDNEFCMWIASEPLCAQEAAAALTRQVPELGRYLERGQIEILDHSQWYTLGGTFDSDRVLRAWIEKLEAALARGYAGLRLTGNTFWLEKADWTSFKDYEAAVDGVIARYPMLALCTYSLERCGADEILDVIANHSFALIKRGGMWETVENAERKRMEVSLHEAEARLRAAQAELEARRAYDLLHGFMAGTTDKIAALDLNFRYMECNQAYRDEFRAIFGTEVGVGSSMIEALAHLPEDQKSAVEIWGRALRGETFTLEREFGDPARQRNSYEIHFFPILDAAGRTTGATHIARDVTARRQAEEALKESNEALERRVAERTATLAQREEHLRAAAMAGQIGIWSWKPGTSDVTVSANWRQLFGAAPDSPVTFETWAGALHPDDRQRAVGEINAAVREHRDFDSEYRVVQPDGTVRWVVDRGRASYDSAGNAAGMSGVNVDITARKRAEEALREQQEWLRVTLTSIGDAVLATTVDGAVSFLNPVAARLTGWSEQEALGRPIQEVLRLTDEVTGVADDIAGRALREGRTVSLSNHTVLLTRSGRWVPIEDSAAPIRDAAGNVTGVVVVFHDVTGQRRNQEVLRASERRVRNKLQAILSPEGDIGALELGDIIDAESVQSLMEDFYRLTQVPVAIIDLKGEVLVGAGWQKVCTDFHRVHPQTCQHCIESNTELTAGIAPGEFRIYKCKNNMWDAATPLIVGGRLVGNLFSGPFFFDDEPVDYGAFHSQAALYGFEEPAYLAALERVPRISRQKVATGVGFLIKLGQMLSLLSYGNIKLARAVAERDALTASSKESAERLERSQAIAHLGSWELDLAKNRLSWSDEVYRIFGLQPQEFGATYEAFLEAVHPEDRAAVDSAYSSSLRERRDSYEITHRVVRRNNGEIRWVHEKCEHTRDANGTIVRSTGMVQDITERRDAEEALRRSEEQLRLSIEATQGLPWRIDFDPAEPHALPWDLAVPASHRQALGIGPAEPLTLADWFRRMEPSGREAGERLVREFLMGSETQFEAEYRILHAGGGYRWLHTRSALTRDRGGRPLCWNGIDWDITARKRSEEALRESEERFRLMADNAPLLIWVNGPDGCEFVNRGYLEFLGRPASEVLGMEWKTALHPDDAQVYLEAYRKALAQQTMFNAQFRFRRTDGQYRWFKSAGVPRFSAGGEFLGYVGCSVDITDLKQAEEALLESESLLRTVCENTADCVFLKDRNSRMLLANPATLLVIGKPPAEVMGRDDTEFYDDPAIGRAIVETDRQVIESGETQVVEETVDGPGGRRVFLSTKTPWRDSDGRVAGIVGVAHDITMRSRAEETVRRSEAMYRGIARNLPDGSVYVVDRNLRCLVAEGCLMSVIGHDRSKLEGQTVGDALGPGGEERFRRALAGEPAEYEDECAGRTIWSHYVPLRDEDDAIVGAMSLWLDISERKRVEAHLRHAQKLDSIGLLAGGIAHDFNNLLVGVIGNASLVEDMLPYGSPATDVVRRIVKSGEQAAHLTRQMLAYAGKGRTIVEPVDLSLLVRESAPLIQSSISKKVSFSLHLPSGIPPVESDPSQMQQIFMNLALNAAEAIGSNTGVVSIRTGAVDVDAAYIRREQLESWPIQPGRHVFLAVQDTGCGMDDETRSRIFDPFFTTKFQGRGLGLAAVAGIVRAHNGAIELTTAPGLGATFRVLLPAAAAPAPEKIPAATRADLGGQGTVLVVDDEEIVRAVARMSLERHGYRVLVAESGLAAIEVIAVSPSRIDAVVLDLSMPVMSGEETLPRLLALDPDLKVIVSSGYSESEALQLFQGAGVAGFIQKPYTIQELARKVKSVVNQAARGQSA